MLNIFQNQLYYLEQFADQLVSFHLTHLNWLSLTVVFISGLLTSLTPCMLSMLPITIGYIGGYEKQGRKHAIIQSAWFSLGLATTLTGLGIIAAYLGRIYGQIGAGLPIFVSLIAVLMGLNLLELIPLKLPFFGKSELITNNLPAGIRSYSIGLTFGLVASPCSTPVLATLLAWIASTQDLLLGGILLLFYTIGYVTPLIVVGIFTASLKRLLELRRWSVWINPVSGILLVSFGILSLLSRLPFTSR
ncbi:cytochrome c biogenesis protein CcdA [Cyanobacterium sp. uoEpiScrs1]|uniref:cytochrome c biogenesis protein CcdA n=1 Tax=Cyanobacterium sp. uoEpiScrs1 TaxID=2976343 RepID=UPI002269C840|nr:cytochrome c biogenesis protein CcdA [Cyanobacterium sp. uoEpiScrs1]